MFIDKLSLDDEEGGPEYCVEEFMSEPCILCPVWQLCSLPVFGKSGKLCAFLGI